MLPIKFVLRQVIFLSGLLVFVLGKFIPYISKGKNAMITQFPHSVFMKMECVSPSYSSKRFWTCGASILNHRVLLTAAHCLSDCDPKKSFLILSVGSINKGDGEVYHSVGFQRHPYNEPSKVIYDVGLVKTHTCIVYGPNVQRVALMPSPPYHEPSLVAGWGRLDNNGPSSATLQYTNQIVLSNAECVKRLGVMHVGSICADVLGGIGHPQKGDSGSALIVRNYIQIGTVSYRLPKTADTIVVYSDVGFHIKWIRKTARHMLCSFEENDEVCPKEKVKSKEEKKLTHIRQRDKINVDNK